MKLSTFWTVPLSIIRSYSLYTQPWYMSYRFVDSFWAGSGWNWWWTNELSKTCRFSFQNKFEKLVHLVGFIIRKFVTMHGHINVKYCSCIYRPTLTITNEHYQTWLGMVNSVDLEVLVSTKPTVNYNAIQSNLAHSSNIRISVFWHLILCHWVFPNILKDHTAFIFRARQCKNFLNCLTLNKETVQSFQQLWTKWTAIYSTRLEYTASCFINEYAMNDLY
jgi:hypothetical protein